MAIRRKHFRTNRFGTTCSVREHNFESSNTKSEFRLSWNKGRALINGAVTYNMRCFGCGATVFFYRNDAGSRVFFDKLGVPWPKHDCPKWSRRMETEPITSARVVTKQSVGVGKVDGPGSAPENPTKKVHEGFAKRSRRFKSKHRHILSEAKHQKQNEKRRQERIALHQAQWVADGKPEKATSRAVPIENKVSKRLKRKPKEDD
ncbi:hypothetical protein PH7735_02394 [Shimia thalassica]|uniref:Uncharacterized protein n=1 Tax=Shimia thalassica TaxID=1715693 RepID=A0A0P1IH58_9RHOB|nr:hypothetical protein [Shimia thalassica]CUK00964.1 hypothetical protein PH7735_02394 [Shimia thalassica]